MVQYRLTEWDSLLARDADTVQNGSLLNTARLGNERPSRS
jgi:hypothetical protein